MEAGVRVVRGPDWNLGDEDGGEGHVGTVTGQVGDDSVKVVWDGGQVSTCRGGLKKGTHDLRVLDNGTVVETWLQALDIFIPFVKNVKNQEYKAYDGNVQSVIILISAHCATSKTATTAAITSGELKHLTHPSGKGNTGQVMEVLTTRSLIQVEWENGSRNVYRLGYKGKVDLQYEEEAPGMECYLQHLPFFKLTKYCRLKEDEECEVDNIAEGDTVCICVGREKLEQLQKSRSGWVVGMSEYIGKTGKVKGFAPNGDAIVVFGSKKYRLFPRVLKKVSKISVGDRVRILHDFEKFHLLQNGRHCNPVMHNTLGKVGEVTKVLEGDEGLVITFKECQGVYNPACCTLAPGEQIDSITISHGDNNSGISLGCGSSLHVLLMAITNHDEKFALEILKKDPKLATARIQGETPLHFAASCGLLSIAQALVAAGANINEQNSDGNIPLYLSMSNAEVAEFLIKQGCDVTIANKTGQTASHLAATKGCVPILNLLLSKGADFNSQDSNGDTPLHSAIFNSQISAAEVIISWPQLDIHRKNKEGFAPLHYAAFKGQSAIVELLLKRDKTIVDTQRDDGCTALHVSAAEDHHEVMKVLTEGGGAKVDRKNSKSQTSLHLACQKCNLDCVRLLIKKGAGTNSKDDKGNTPLHLAVLAAPKENELMLMALIGQSPKKKEDHSKHESKFPEVPSCTKASSAPDKCARCLGNEPEILFVPWGHVVIEWFAGLVATICTYVSNVVFPS
ncbi:hypothetical protein C0Q70_02581 [Pomacea canaliculata]|uniref:RING-type E3 ubiquitin transferase n=1 Tax=Pomacea canaliculata TaxID=400727 RepID=A0A2T7PQC3_POMCA|nr:hypothetical protein C0Q70_02581 [Pomacea canaliculata]